MGQETGTPLVSIIIPCRNEEKFIGKCIDSIIANDYPKERLEFFIVDGMSDDGTRQIEQRYGKKYPFIKVLDNPKKITPCALNKGIKYAKGQIVMRMDAHTTYERDYISKCVRYLSEYNADNVGGICKIIPRDSTFIGKAIALASSHPFGGGDAYYRIGYSKELRFVDTVPFGCYKKEIFEKVGLFNENLVRSQDMEFNLRLRKAGGKILLHPDIVGYYYAYSDFKSFLKHRFLDGIWAIYPIKFVSHMPISWRHLAPLTFVSSLIVTLGLGWLLSFLIISGSYFLFNLLFSTEIALKEKDFRYFFIMPVVFAGLHTGYGLGSVFAFISCLVSKEFWKNRWPRQVLRKPRLRAKASGQ